MQEHDAKFTHHNKKIREIFEELERHQKDLMELKDFKEFQIKTNDKIEDRAKKQK